MDGQAECDHEWRHILTERCADFHAGRRISGDYWVRLDACAHCGQQRETVQQEPPPAPVRRWIDTDA
jgi:hypothetical protein